jgi:hypothetical protein
MLSRAASYLPSIRCNLAFSIIFDAFASGLVGEEQLDTQMMAVRPMMIANGFM